MKPLCHITVFVLSLTYSAIANSPADSLGRLRIVSEPGGADVYVDSFYVGKTPVEGISLREGPHRVRLYYPSVMAWNALASDDTVRVMANSQSEKVVEMGTAAAIRSFPSGATVTYQQMEMGTTPLYLRTAARLHADLVLQKEGYEPQHVSRSRLDSGSIVARLVPKTRVGVAALNDLPPDDQRALTSQSWPLYVSGSTMIVSGVLSAYLKDQANREFDRYLRSADPALLSSTRRLDRAAAVTLAISQVSFAVLSYLLLSE